MTARPIYFDNNAFEYFSEKERHDLFISQLEKSTNIQAQELVKALKAAEFIKHPLALIELFWLPQKAIHQELEKIIPSFYPAAKEAVAPFLNVFKRSDQSPEDWKKLGKGLDAAIDILYNAFFNHLWCCEPGLSLPALEAKIESRQQQLSNPSPLFLNKYEFIKETLNNSFRKGLIRDLSFEAVYRYGGNLISRLYTGDNALNQRWFDHLLANYFVLWEKKRNYSAYRLIGEELELLNRKYNLNFFPARKLRPHDDTVDGYIVHALSFGWFNSLQKLTSLSILSEDPCEEIIDRVQQYQTYLAYAQNPLGNNINATSRILHEVLPGTLYSFDRKACSLKIVSFHPAKILKGSPHPQIVHSRSEIETISLNV